MTREEVRDLMFSVKTLSECEAAWKAREAWLQLHPDDEQIIEEGESLYMTEQSLKRLASQKPEKARVA